MEEQILQALKYKSKYGRFLSRREIKFIIRHHNADMTSKEIADKLDLTRPHYSYIVHKYFKKFFSTQKRSKNCIICGKFYIIRSNIHTTCGKKKCIRQNKIKRSRERADRRLNYVKREVICEICGNKFITKRRKQKRCAQSCAKKDKKNLDNKLKKIIYSKHREKYYKYRPIILQTSEEKRARIKEYCNNNRSYFNALRRTRYKKDISFKMKINIGNRIRHALKNNSKKTKSIQYIGCSIEQLWMHLEKQFTHGMARENYGKWQIDHIIPCSYFDLSKVTQQKVCFHYSNLQPLWAKDNQQKNNKIA